ncbi:LysR family transcriptional regulator [Caloramator sp. E03]|uniref:LysR family transcriptional regulator n=1 Tax=Caloramator sp. E03 TaxID=2576307 RepID=UPI00143D2013|nr:LysR family transcriptional regulator [Caloramator sp. E03]
MDILQIKYFYYIVKLGSFSEAAAELNISQSSLSKRISSLENELNVMLFDRTTRRVNLTDAGKIFLSFSEKILFEYEDIQNKLKDFSIPAKGKLKISTIPVMSQYNITSLISGFKEIYPGINIFINETEYKSILYSLYDSEYSLAFLRTNYIDMDKFDIIPISTDKLSVCIPKNHPFASKKSIDINEIKNEKLILLDQNSGIYDIVVSACKSACFEPNILYTNTRIETIIGLIAAGEGISLLMDKVVRFFNNPDIYILPLSKPINSTIALVKLKKQKLSSNEKLFWNYVSEVFSKKNV